MDTSLAYAQWLEATGKAGEAENVLDKLQSLRPNDPSLVKQLMERARAAGDKAKAAELSRSSSILNQVLRPGMTPNLSVTNLQSGEQLVWVSDTIPVRHIWFSDFVVAKPT